MTERRRGSVKTERLQRIEELMGTDQGGYSLGNRTNEPHHPDGWDAKRESKEEPEKGDAPKRGTLRSGTHDQSEAHE